MPHHDRSGLAKRGRRLLLAMLVVPALAGCAAQMADRSDKDEEHAAEHQRTTTARLTTSEDRVMLFEGSCHFLACCSKRNCSLAASAVIGACGTGCSDSTPWIARPNRDSRYACGECVRVCVRGTTNCANAAVWDNSITSSSIEGNIALFDALGLAHTDNATSCSGSGEARVTVGPCTGDTPADRGSDAGTSDPGTSDPGTPEPETSEPGGSEPGGSDPSGSACSCDASCGYCWCGTSNERSCSDAWYGTGDGCDCGCQWSDPDCSGSTPSGGTPGGTPAGTFAGVYCTNPGLGCGGNTPCWPASDCPSGSVCDWSAGSWGRCME